MKTTLNLINSVPPVVEKGTWVALDVETFGQEEGKVHRPTGRFACLSIYMGGKDVYQIYEEKQVKIALRNLSKATWLFHNALYDLTQLRRYTDIKPRFIWDTQLVEQSMTGGLYDSYSLKSLVRRWLGVYISKDTREEFSKKQHMTKEMREYAADDVLYTMQIAHKQRECWEGDKSFRAYTTIDEPLIFPTLDMGGMRVDEGKWTETVTFFHNEAVRLEQELGFNSKSPVQCLAALKKVGIHVRSSGAGILETINHPLAKAILNVRLYRDAESKYGLKWLEENVEDDGKVYSSWHITGAKTGRMSSSSPNLQNIPVRKLPIYRTFFIPSEGNILMICDAHQQEPCITAYETGDRELLRGILAGEDLHLTVAKSIYGDFNKSDPDYDEKRAVGKAINLGTTYGLSEYGLSTRLGITEQEASFMLIKYFTRFRDVHLWIQTQRRTVEVKGYITTASGRRSYINPHDWKSRNNAINSPIQGGAADMQKLWIRKFWENCRREGLPYTLVAPVHDEGVKDVPKEIKVETKRLSDEAFHEAADILFKGVPFTVETEMGRSWAAKKLKEERYEDDDE